MLIMDTQAVGKLVVRSADWVRDAAPPMAVPEMMPPEQSPCLWQMA